MKHKIVIYTPERRIARFGEVRGNSVPIVFHNIEEITMKTLLNMRRARWSMPNQHSKITEKVLYKLILNEMSTKLEQFGYKANDYHIVRIESVSSPGVPDINVCFDEHEFWIEAKVAPNQLRNYQIGWKKKRELAGGVVYVITWITEDLIMIFDNSYKDMKFKSLGEALEYIIVKERSRDDSQ